MLKEMKSYCHLKAGQNGTKRLLEQYGGEAPLRPVPLRRNAQGQIQDRRADCRREAVGAALQIQGQRSGAGHGEVR